MEYKNGDVVLYGDHEAVITNDIIKVYNNNKFISIKSLYKPLYYADVRKVSTSSIQYLRKVKLEEISNFTKGSIVGVSILKDYISNKVINNPVYGIVTGDFEIYRGDVILTIVDKNYKQYKFLSRNLFGIHSTHKEYIALSNTLTDYQIF